MMMNIDYEIHGCRKTGQNIMLNMDLSNKCIAYTGQSLYKNGVGTFVFYSRPVG
jgi:hypothetical protein